MGDGRTPREYRELKSYELPKDDLDIIEAQKQRTGDPKWHIIHEAIQARYGQNEDSITFHDRRADELQQEREELIEQKKEIIEKLDVIESQIDHHKSRADELRDERGSYNEQLDELLDQVADSNDGVRVWAFRDLLEGAAETEYGVATLDNIDAVIEDAQRRAEERNLDLAPYRFEEGSFGSPSPSKQPSTRLKSLESIEGSD